MFGKIIKKFKKKPKHNSVDDIMKAIKELQLPQVKQVYPTLLSNQIVGVQPMQAPSSGWQTTFSGNTITYTKPKRARYGPLGQKGALITDALIKDILNNWENIEVVLYDIPQINITLKNVPITAQSRKLKAAWNVQPSKNLATLGFD